ncbi:hypothetical protein C8J55DRAFT_491863 [Lentinula edodes]|uniref:Uncharacterized protein n=1 Tax=Lentinula lateritia TaxID=40482 RepID=A0A9W8ZYQ4_9AGAR|nr:hypothetical protein C8J55DRAFT_491863 [Lentinula edodes]
MAHCSAHTPPAWNQKGTVRRIVPSSTGGLLLLLARLEVDIQKVQVPAGDAADEKLLHLNQKRNHIDNERDIEVQIVAGGHRRMDIQGMENPIWHNNASAQALNSNQPQFPPTKDAGTLRFLQKNRRLVGHSCMWARHLFRFQVGYTESTGFRVIPGLRVEDVIRSCGNAPRCILKAPALGFLTPILEDGISPVKQAKEKALRTGRNRSELLIV